MLIAYHEGFLTLIRICALFCILVMVYNLFNHLTQGLRAKLHRKRIDQIKALLTAFPETDTAAGKKLCRTLRRILRREMGLLALLTALDELQWTSSRQILPRTRQLLCELLTELYLKVYRKAEDYIQGLIINLFIRCDVTSSRLKAELLDQLENTNLLVRIEALRCICAQRNRKMVVMALEKLSKDRLSFNGKMITDILMTFPGDCELLAEALWQAMPEFSEEIRVAVINLLAAEKHASFAGRLIQVLQDQKADMEVRLAAIKYFGRVREPACVPVLAQLLSENTWEYAAIAANTLANYDCSGVFEPLLAGICSRNWYVRRNCARTIVYACTPGQIEAARNVPDRYGRDSISYAMDMKRKEAVVK